MSKTPVLYLATANHHKLEEIKRFFKKNAIDWEVYSANKIGGMPNVIEDADTFSGNAVLKATALWKQTKGLEAWVLADDSGIAVDALNGAPGIYSARYAGIDCNDQENNRKLMQALQGVPTEKRTAQYVCALALIYCNAQKPIIFEQNCRGFLGQSPVGNNGFGYDPYFYPEDYSMTFGQLDSNVKDQISHRAKALKDLIKWGSQRTLS